MVDETAQTSQAEEAQPETKPEEASMSTPENDGGTKGEKPRAELSIPSPDSPELKNDLKEKEISDPAPGLGLASPPAGPAEPDDQPVETVAAVEVVQSIPAATGKDMDKPPKPPGARRAKKKDKEVIVTADAIPDPLPGLPTFENPRKNVFLTYYQRNACNMAATCRVTKIGYRTAKGWKQEDPEFAQAMALLTDVDIDEAESNLKILVTRGNLGAIVFFLCNKAPDQWQHVAKIVERSEDGKGIDMRKVDSTKLREILGLPSDKPAEEKKEIAAVPAKATEQAEPAKAEAEPAPAEPEAKPEPAEPAKPKPEPEAVQNIAQIAVKSAQVKTSQGRGV